MFSSPPDIKLASLWRTRRYFELVKGGTYEKEGHRVDLDIFPDALIFTDVMLL